MTILDKRTLGVFITFAGPFHCVLCDKASTFCRIVLKSWAGMLVLEKILHYSLHPLFFCQSWRRHLSELTSLHAHFSAERLVFSWSSLGKWSSLWSNNWTSAFGCWTLGEYLHNWQLYHKLELHPFRVCCCQRFLHLVPAAHFFCYCQYSWAGNGRQLACSQVKVALLHWSAWPLCCKRESSWWWSWGILRSSFPLNVIPREKHVPRWYLWESRCTSAQWDTFFSVSSLWQPWENVFF